ncbi:hypothetical protein [Solirhodobacter olei]|uniref:hypothetical protein n=1 Tax=Solirhodobacter olei TaxID=2493082 RepID=UPI000FD94F23|nr:hypothetical protein [Solirhodobacter olei]
MGEMSRFSRRIAARRALGPEAGALPTAVMTEEDRRNIANFEADAGAVTALLRREVAAIQAGKLDAVTELYEQKTALLKRMEVLMPVVEPFLKVRLAEDEALRERLAALNAAVQEDSALLERMSSATSQIVGDLEKIRDRHSLKGLYGKSGKRVTGPEDKRRRIDKTI